MAVSRVVRLAGRTAVSRVDEKVAMLVNYLASQKVGEKVGK